MYPDMDFNSLSDWLIGGASGLEIDASWGIQFALAKIVQSGLVGNLTKPLRELSIDEVKVIPKSAVDARYLSTCSDTLMCPLDGLCW